MTVELQKAFIFLVRLGLGLDTDKLVVFKSQVNWEALQNLAEKQGLSSIVLDGVDCLLENLRPGKELLLQWIGGVMQDESFFSLQKEVAADIAKLFYRNGIKTYVLKGAVVSECYPKPNHRVSVDIDCYLLPERGDFDAWSLGNDLIRAKGFSVNTDFYKNSSFEISGVNIENHQFFTPFRGHKRLAEFEKLLHALMGQEHDGVFEGTYLYRPPVMVSALFLIEHAYAHFLHEGLTWRHVLDWMMFSRKHQKEILWADFEVLVDEYGFRKFYETYCRLGKYLLGEIDESDLTKVDHKMLADVWSDLDIHDFHGVKGKIALAGNTIRAAWKYHYFSPDMMITDLFRRVKGFVFERHPKL